MSSRSLLKVLALGAAVPVALSSALSCAIAQTTANAAISISPGGARTGDIPTDFMGISLEASSIAAANNNGTEWLSANSGAFATMMKRIGVKSIRVGGNSAERLGYPTVADGKSVGDFANAIGANLLWVLPVKNNTYDNAGYLGTATAMYDDQKAKGYTFKTTFLIGNEPDIDMAASGDNPDDPAIPYSTWRYRYNNYNTQLRAHNNAITASGPSFASQTSWGYDFATDSTYSGSLAYSVGYVTGHTYPLGGAGSSGGSNSQQAITLFLQDNSEKYQGYYDAWASTAAGNGLASRIDETNSMYFDGADQSLTHAYASSLWVLDYLCYMAYKTQLGGMNLHNGPLGSDGYNQFSPIGPATSYNLEALGYGMLAFSYNGQGQPMSANITSNPSNVNLSAYALTEASPSTGASAHILNKTHGSGAVNVTAQVSISGYAHAQVMYLQQSDNEVTALTGITLGGQPVNSNGTWTGTYTVNGLTPTNGVFTISIPHTQAAIVHFYN